MSIVWSLGRCCQSGGARTAMDLLKPHYPSSPMCKRRGTNRVSALCLIFGLHVPRQRPADTVENSAAGSDDDGDGEGLWFGDVSWTMLVTATKANLLQSRSHNQNSFKQLPRATNPFYSTNYPFPLPSTYYNSHLYRNSTSTSRLPIGHDAVPYRAARAYYNLKYPLQGSRSHGFPLMLDLI